MLDDPRCIFDRKPGVKYIEFDAAPLERDDQYRDFPPDCLDAAAARRIAQEMSDGLVSGYVGPYRWYRQAGGCCSAG